MSKQPIGVVSNIDSSGDISITLDNGDIVTVDDIGVTTNIDEEDTIYGQTFSISGTASSGTTSGILDEVQYDGR